MDYEIHLYSAVAKAATALRYPAGEHHPLLVFLRQLPDSAHDFDAAESVATQAGWIDLDFTRAGTLPADASEQTAEPFFSCYRDAVSKGSALLVYEAAVVQAPTQAASP